MLLLTIIQDDNNEGFIENLRNIREQFKFKNVKVGISERIENGYDIIKVYCDDEGYSEKFQRIFDIYIGNIIFKEVVEKFCKTNLGKFLAKNFYFLKVNDIQEVKNNIVYILKNDGDKINDDNIYYINKKNDIVEDIIHCIEENRELNIKGFFTFRLKSIYNELNNIVEKIIEKFMVEKEYNEFIKLLKYFIEVQESKIERVHIIIDNEGKYNVKDDLGKDIFQQLVCELYDERITGDVTEEDLLLSGLITNCPNKIIFHCACNCKNKELIETIKNVFGERVEFRDDIMIF